MRNADVMKKHALAPAVDSYARAAPTSLALYNKVYEEECRYNTIYPVEGGSYKVCDDVVVE